MKTISVTIPIELDQRAAKEARRRGISKSELIRQGLAEVLPESEPEPRPDPKGERKPAMTTAEAFSRLSGIGSPGPVESYDIDEIIYGS